MISRKLDSSWGNVEHLRKNLWGEKLVANAQKLLEIPKIQALLDSAEAYYNRGMAKYEREDWKGAIADYDRAIALNPKLAEAYGNRGLAKVTQGNKQGAIDDMQKAEQLFCSQGSPNDCQKVRKLLKQLQQ